MRKNRRPTTPSAMECSCTQCFYCDKPFPAEHEHDHYPVPAHLGGAHVVPACVDCHTLKDRLALKHWPKVAVDELKAAWPTMSPMMRLLLSKMLAVTLDGIEQQRQARARKQ